MRILVLLLVLAGAVLAGWHYKGRILAWINPPPSADYPAEQPDVLYSWVDKAGVTHYEQDASKGTRIIYDGSRITPLEPVPPEVIARAEAAVEAAKPKGSQMLHELRNDLRHQQPQQGQGGDL